ncbi:endonuclease domain-containing 1 protein-like [Astyanax mexicanus]|uniref:Endonuclease domain-containing 1 protein-like n=1 Tax=Astyanax mexicanus TaxID=7994 RepID=A0A8T2KX76_ASTMX|nr:endonuclease domain-containing 1 protein-like [Astyanax mexicanus]
MKLFAVLLLLGMFSLSVAEVVNSFKDTCPQFFIRNNNNQAVPPTVLKAEQYKQICQFYEKDYRFATLYDIKCRIPVYSAYIYTITEPRKIKNSDWKIEPQLDEKQADREMRRETEEEEKQFRNQSLNKDYRGSGYTKGHVFPKSYAFSDQQKESTFTLTNAAPQTENSNREWAEQVEEEMLKEIKKKTCVDTAYIVTGVVPGKTWLPIERRWGAIVQGVNIPRYFWTAYSCKNNNNINVSKAYISQQIIPTPKGETNFKVKNMTVDELNKKFETGYYKTPFRVFG